MEAIMSRNNIRVMGKGTRPLIFGHGFGADQNMWKSINLNILKVSKNRFPNQPGTLKKRSCLS